MATALGSRSKNPGFKFLTVIISTHRDVMMSSYPSIQQAIGLEGSSNRMVKYLRRKTKKTPHTITHIMTKLS